MKTTVLVALGGMMILIGILTASISDTSANASGAPRADPQAGPVLLELFTSQGCSSCPPADRFAAQLVARDDVVVVTRPVTYWDRLGWKDTLALPANTDLQRAYARRGLEGRNGVYTPQLVANGQHGTVGSRREAVRTIIREEASSSAAIASKTLSDGRVVVGLGGVTSGTATLSLLALDSQETVRIGRGENGGRNVTYTNVLRAETELKSWSGGKDSIILAASQLWTVGADRFALILREGENGRVIAARYVA